MSHEEQGFKVVKLLTHRSARPRGKTTSCHHLFVKEYAQKRSQSILGPGKTLFVVNVPPYVREDDFKFAYEHHGFSLAECYLSERPLTLTDVDQMQAQQDDFSKYFNPKPHLNAFKCAYLVFRAPSDLRRAIRIDELCLFDAERETTLVSGLDAWMKQYMDGIPKQFELKMAVVKYMDIFETKEQELKEAERQEEVVDEDGWTTVKKGRKSGFEQKETILNRLEDKIAVGKKKKELANFYTFQIRESKQQHIVSLRKRFEDDKRKIEDMKKARRFKPY